LAEEAVVADAVTPEAGELGFERLAEAAWVFTGGDALLEVCDDVFLTLAIEFQ
jgi:hypothetical protein